MPLRAFFILLLGLSVMVHRRAQEIRDQEFAFYANEVAKVNDPKMLILLAHLYVEHLMERYLVVKIQSTNDFFGKNGLSFEKKVSLVESFGNFNGHILAGLRKLDQLRNDCMQKFMFEPSTRELEEMVHVLLADEQTLPGLFSADAQNPWQTLFAFFCGQVLGEVILVENDLPANSFMPESGRNYGHRKA